MSPFVDSHMIYVTRFWARLGLTPQEIAYWFREHEFMNVRVRQVEDTLQAIGHVYPPRRQWDHIAIGLVVMLFRLGVSTRKILEVMNVVGWDVGHNQIIRALKRYESLRMAADPNFAW